MSRPVGRHARQPQPKSRETVLPRRGGWLQAVSLWLLAVGLLLGVQFSWAYWGMGLDVTYTQRTVAERSGWTGETPVVTKSDPVAQPQEGDPPEWEDTYREGAVLGWMYIPRLDENWMRAVQESTDQAVLDNLGLGHYSTSAMPGQIGNSAFAGHRTPSDLGYADRLQPGDVIVFRDADHWYVYKVDRTPYIVPGTQVSVLDSSGPSVRELTLTTCDPMFSVSPAADRLIVHAVFDSWMNVKDGTPQVLLGDQPQQDTQVQGVSGQVAAFTRRVERLAHDVPVTPVLALCAFTIWLIVNGLAFAFSRNRLARWRTGGIWDPLTVMWRAQYGPLWLRIPLMLVFQTGVVFVLWAYACPLLADWVPFLSAPHPTI